MANAQTRSTLPPSLPPRGLSRVQAAEYIGISVTLFDEFISEGKMPPPRKANSRNLWDRHQLDVAFSELPSKTDENPWD